MRILMVTQSYPPIIGGIEYHVRHLSQRLSERGHTVAVATLWQPGLLPLEEDGPVRVHRLRATVHRAAGLLFSNPGRWYAPPFPDPGLMGGLRALLRSERPDIVHAHNWMVHSYTPLKRASGAPLVVTMHDYGLVCAKWTLMYRGAPCSGPAPFKCLECSAQNYGVLKGWPTAISSSIMSAWERRVVDLFVPVSNAVAQGTDLVGSRWPYRVVPNFLPDESVTEPLSPAAQELVRQLPSGGYILFVGAFGTHKGFGVLLEAYRQLRERLADAPPLVLIGYETGEFELAKMDMPEGAVAFKQWPHDAVMEAWRRCSIGVVPSVSGDPCPTVAMEAMSAGKPVLASAIGGLPDLVEDGITGRLLSPGDATALAEALLELLRDPALAARYGAAGKAKFAAFSASNVVPRIEALYGELLAAQRKA